MNLLEARVKEPAAKKIDVGLYYPGSPSREDEVLPRAIRLGTFCSREMYIGEGRA